MSGKWGFLMKRPCSWQCVKTDHRKTVCEDVNQKRFNNGVM